MNRIDELNKAIAILRDECSEHEECEECPLCQEGKYVNCGLYKDPWSWKKLEEHING